MWNQKFKTKTTYWFLCKWLILGLPLLSKVATILLHSWWFNILNLSDLTIYFSDNKSEIWGEKLVWPPLYDSKLKCKDRGLRLNTSSPVKTLSQHQNIIKFEGYFKNTYSWSKEWGVLNNEMYNYLSLLGSGIIY